MGNRELGSHPSLNQRLPSRPAQLAAIALNCSVPAKASGGKAFFSYKFGSERLADIGIKYNLQSFARLLKDDTTLRGFSSKSLI